MIVRINSSIFSFKGLFMKKFLLNIFVFVTACICITFALFFLSMSLFAPQYTHSYMGSVSDKIERLESIKTPKIILVTHSSLAFGIKSPMIEKALGMPVINLGMHGGLGNRFHEDMAKYNIGKGDIVVICHSWYSDNGKISDHELAWATIENHWHLYPLVRHDILEMAESFPAYFNKVLKRFYKHEDVEVEGCYSRDAFNKYGDNIYPRQKSEYTFYKGAVAVPEINSTCTKRLNKLNLYCHRRGATLVAAGYPIGDGEFTPSKQLFKDAWNTLQGKLDFPIISNIEDYFFPYSDFYNTNIHLTDGGAVKYTQNIIHDLQRANIIP